MLSIVLLGWQLPAPEGVYAQGTAVQSAFAAETSVSTSVMEAGRTQELTYTFKVVYGMPTLWRIALSGEFGNLVVRSITLGDKELWIIHQTDPPTQPSVVSWTSTDRLLEFRTYPEDVKPGDQLKVTFLIAFPDLALSSTLDGWIGDSGKAGSLVRCLSNKTTLHKGSPQD